MNKVQPPPPLPSAWLDFKLSKQPVFPYYNEEGDATDKAM